MDKIAIVGGGPSAFYVASRLLSRLPAHRPRRLAVHVFDRLWAPHGLVRFGVAPDHPEVKNCTHKFDAAALDSRFRYFGNVQVGPAPASVRAIPHVVPLALPDVFDTYTHLVFSGGCPVPTHHPALAPSPRILPALDVVHWYTHHPSNPPPPPLESCTHVTILGHGNVALDVARMLLTHPDALAAHDVPTPVLTLLRRSAIRHVSLLGRRGPRQAAFTAKELRELTSLPDASMVPLDPALLAVPDGENVPRQQRRVLELLRKGSAQRFGTTPKTWSLDFFRAPSGVTSSPTSPSSPSPSSHALTLDITHTTLDINTRAISTSTTSTLPTDLVISALGHRLDPTAPFVDPSTGTIPVDAAGRVLDAVSRTPVAGVFASGWAAMGARGVLASTMLDAYNVADGIARGILERDSSSSSDVDNGGSDGAERVLRAHVDPADDAPPQAVQDALRAGLVVSYDDWKRVDAEEIRRGVAPGKERERMEWEEARAFLGRTP